MGHIKGYPTYKGLSQPLWHKALTGGDWNKKPPLAGKAVELELCGAIALKTAVIFSYDSPKHLQSNRSARVNRILQLL